MFVLYECLLRTVFCALFDTAHGGDVLYLLLTNKARILKTTFEFIHKLIFNRGSLIDYRKSFR